MFAQYIQWGIQNFNLLEKLHSFWNELLHIAFIVEQITAIAVREIAVIN